MKLDAVAMALANGAQAHAARSQGGARMAGRTALLAKHEFHPWRVERKRALLDREAAQ